MTLTISMPVYNTPNDLLNKAVNSVLSQTFRDIQLILINDGGSHIGLNSKDSRIVVYEIPQNRGRYFADAVVLSACNSELFTIHDSDDTAAHNRFEHMINANKANNPITVETNPYLKHNEGQAALKKHRQRPTMKHFWFISAIYKTDFIKNMIHPGFRVGYDTIICSVAPLFGEVTISHPLLYKRFHRLGSLTTSPETGIRSSFRQNETKKLEHLFSKLKAQKSLDLVKKTIYADISQELLEELSFHSAQLQKEVII